MSFWICFSGGENVGLSMCSSGGENGLVIRGANNVQAFSAAEYGVKNTFRLEKVSG